jgi:uncharacterized protein YecE (DUF72 family)/predicted nuclease of predicted toxin-antitoxin system
VRFLANENFPLDAVEAVRKLGHDVGWIRIDAPGSKDRDVLQRAMKEQRILLTFDKDFGDLAFQADLPATCGVVLFRVQAKSSSALAALVAAGLTSRLDWAGNFSVIEPRRIRMRPLSSPPISKGHGVNLYVGTSGYAYPAWKGKFYHAKLPAKQMLRYYGEHFRSVERNDTFRGIPKASAVEGWTEAVPADFKFALKAPQRITHIKRLREAGDLVSQFIEFAELLERRLGPLLFQLPPNFKKDVPRLREFLGLLPLKHRITFEFRHQSWFDDEVLAVLREHKAALCISDENADLQVPFVSTADWGYLRLRQLDYDDAALKTWLNRIRAQEWRDVFVFFKHEDEGKGPRFAQRLLEMNG